MSLNQKGANPGKEKSRLIHNGLHFWEEFLRYSTLVMKGVCWLLVCGVF